MRWDCDKRTRERKQWHRWFAWHPVHVDYGECVWLENVWRKGHFHFDELVEWWEFEYSVNKPDES